MLQRAMAQTRGLARGLSPVGLEGLGLAEALRDLASSTSRLYRCQCRFRARAPALAPSHATAIHLYRIAQEAVNNAHKHGRAKRIEIRLTANGRVVVLRVADNGIGLSSKLPPGTGMGLRIMRYRAEVIGGVLEVKPRRHGGTQVSCTVTEEPFTARITGGHHEEIAPLTANPVQETHSDSR